MSESYDEYLQSDWWREFRKRKLHDAGGKCERCDGTETLQVHHKRYKDDRGRSILYRETFDDVMLLDEQCHEYLHGKSWSGLDPAKVPTIEQLIEMLRRL